MSYWGERYRVHYCEGMSDIIGKKIMGVFVDKESQRYLYFDTDKGQLCYEAMGDCCSETWVADITGVNYLLNSTVIISVEETELPDPKDGRTRQESDELYSYKITTDKGYSDIVFRNSSNGYYGGHLALLNEVPETEFINIVEDYSA